MGVPDELAVHGAGADEAGKPLDLFGEGALLAEVLGQAVGAHGHFGAVDHDGGGADSGRTSADGSDLVVGCLVFGSDLVASDYGVRLGMLCRLSR